MTDDFFFCYFFLKRYKGMCKMLQSLVTHFVCPKQICIWIEWFRKVVKLKHKVGCREEKKLWIIVRKERRENREKESENKVRYWRVLFNQWEDIFLEAA